MSLKWVRGHLIYGIPYDFPHLCPGEDCAIGTWLLTHYREAEYRRE